MSGVHGAEIKLAGKTKVKVPLGDEKQEKTQKSFPITLISSPFGFRLENRGNNKKEWQMQQLLPLYPEIHFT